MAWETEKTITDINGITYSNLTIWNSVYGAQSAGDVFVRGANRRVNYHALNYANQPIVIPFYRRDDKPTMTSLTPVLLWKIMDGAFFYVAVENVPNNPNNNYYNASFRIGIVNNTNPSQSEMNACGYGQSGIIGEQGVMDYRRSYLALVIWGNTIGVTECDANGVTIRGVTSGSTIAVDAFLAQFGLTPPFGEKEYSPEYGNASDTGGYSGGTFDDSSDTIPIPIMPTLGVSNAGFINVYNPSSGALANFGADLFPDFTPVEGGTDVTDAIVNLGKNVTNAINMMTNSRLIDYIIDCHILPVTPTAQTAEQIRVGFKTFPQVAPKISTDYFDYDCGKLNIGEYYGNFIDYGGFTQAKLYLPFVGFVSIQPEFWQSGTLQIIYRFNIIDGSFMCFVLSSSSKSKLTDTVIGQYGGNACVHIPITGLNYSSMISGVVSGASGALSSISSGNIGGVASSAEQVLTSAPTMQSSNSYNATTAFLGVRTPYLLIERSVSHFSKNYANERGIPSQITTKFDSLSGFTRATVEHLDGFDGVTDEELNEIRQLLAEGVIF